MNVIKGIGELFKDNANIQLAITIDSRGLTVYLADNNYGSSKDKYIIPIRIDAHEPNIYVPSKKLSKTYEINELGMSIDDIKWVLKVMTYLEKHSDEIVDICCMLDPDDREVS